MEFSNNRVFRLGTRIKTRYEPCEIYLRFDPEKKGFALREDPDIEKMKQMRDVMLEAEPSLNQKTARELLNNELDMPDKEIRKLLRKGEREFWSIGKGLKNASIYYPYPTTGELAESGQTEELKEEELCETLMD